MDDQIQVEITEVLRITQARLQSMTEQAIMLEALVSQQKIEIEQLKGQKKEN